MISCNHSYNPAGVPQSKDFCYEEFSSYEADQGFIFVFLCSNNSVRSKNRHKFNCQSDPRSGG